MTSGLSCSTKESCKFALFFGLQSYKGKCFITCFCLVTIKYQRLSVLWGLDLSQKSSYEIGTLPTLDRSTLAEDILYCS